MYNLKEKIKSIKCLEGIIFLRRYKLDDDLKKIIKSYNEKKIIILYDESKCNADCHKNIYYIKIERPTSGFFACWLWGLKELYFADKFNLKPFIDWSDKSPYYEEKGVNGIKNPFEYFFEQVSELSINEALEGNGIFDMLNVRTGTYSKEIDYYKLAEINRKYMKLKDNISEKITNDIKQLIGNKKTLAVHIRGVEWGNIKGHPIPLDLDKYIEEIDKAIKKENFEQIFLATDSEDTIEYLSNRYEKKIVYYNDVARASKGSKTLAIFDSTIQRENNHYLLGLEVLRDMITLSKCDGLIAGCSNISIAAQITKLSNDKKYDYKCIFEQKTTKNGISSKKAVDKMRKGKF